MLKKLIIYSTLLLVIFPLNAKCLKISSKDVQIKWTAFKTSSKIGVGGSFKDIKLKSKLTGRTIKEIAYGSEFVINTQSVETNNPSRNKKIEKFFFSNLLGGDTMTGSIGQLKEATLTLNLILNKVSKAIPMKYTIIGSELKATGVIDVFDFKLGQQLQALNKACLSLHKGKTWNDVNIELIANFSKCDQ